MKTLLNNIDGLLITNPTNIRYLTGFVGMSENEREAYVLLTQDVGYIFTNSLYRESAKNVQCPTRLPGGQVPNVQWKLVEFSREQPFAKKLKEILLSAIPAYAGIQKNKDWIPAQDRNDNRVRLGFEEDDLKVSEFNSLRKVLKGITLIPTKNHIEKMRMIKREDEIEKIREAARLTDECFNYILGKLKPASRRGGSASRGGLGLTESEIAWEIEAFIRKNGANLAFSPIVAFGKNSSQPHYQPSTIYSSSEESSTSREVYEESSRLRSNDIILLDFGARVNGYCSDMTRMVFVGKPKPEWLRAYDTVLRAQESAINYLRALGPALSSQLSGKKADQIARTIIREAGYPPYPHSLGHGVGLAIHEIPRLIARKDRILPKFQPRKDAILLPGMVFTIEPGIYIEGQYGIRIEDLILLKKNGIEILTQSSKKLIIL